MAGRYDDEDDSFEERLAKRSRTGADRPAPAGGTGLSDFVDMLGRRLSGAILGAGAMIALGVYAGGSGEIEVPTYQGFSAGSEVFRLNTDSGTLIACNGERCMRVLERGQDLAEDQANTLFKAPAGAQLPAPSPAPVAAPAPAGQQALPAPTK